MAPNAVRLFEIVAPINGSFEIVPSGNVSPLSTMPLTVIVSVIAGMFPFKMFCGSCTFWASEVIGMSMAMEAADIPARATAFPARERARSCCSK